MIENKGKLRKTIQNITEKTQGLFISMLILVVLLMVSACFMPRVFQSKDPENLLRTYVPGGVIAIGLSLVILTGGVDVSVGMIMTLTMAIAAKIYDISGPAAIVTICCIGTAAGFLNGRLITGTKVPSLMLTIGTTPVFNGLTAILVRAWKRYTTDLYYITLTLAKGSIFSTPISPLLCVALALMFGSMLRKSAFGEEIYYTDTSKRASWVGSVDISRIKIICFIVSGLLAATAALLMLGQSESPIVQLGNGYGITTVSIAILGDISLDGEKGTIIGTSLGFTVIGLMRNMFVTAGFGTHASMTLKGAMIILVVYLYGLTARKWA